MTAVKTGTIPWWRTDISEADIAAVGDALRSRQITQGPRCLDLEAQLAAWLGVPEVVVCSSGSAALLLALMAAGVGPGDEVLVPGVTFIAAAHAALLLGASVRVVDVLPDRPVIDPEAATEAIGPRTKALVAVHLGGRACDLQALENLSERTGVALIEDAAQALGARGSAGYLGTTGHYGAFSLGITKLLSSGEGGFAIARDSAQALALRRLRNQGSEALADNVFEHRGFNLRLTDFQAAMAVRQLADIQVKMESIRRVYRHYRDGMAGLDSVRLLPVDLEQGEFPLWTEVVCSDRNQLIEAMRALNIQAKPYHPGLHGSPHLGPQGPCPNTDFFCSHGLVLPSGPDQPEEDIDRVLEALSIVAPSLPPFSPQVRR